MFFLRVDLVKSCDLMWKQSVWTSVLAAQISSKHLKELVESSTILPSISPLTAWGQHLLLYAVCLLHSVL